MKEWLYGQDSSVIMLVLIILTVLAVQAGRWFGRRSRFDQEPYKNHMGAMLASLMGLLALLLGFSFSLALQRHEARSVAVVEEANAIGTVFLRASLIPVELRRETQAALRDYVDLRIQESIVSASDQPTRQRLLDQADDVAGRIWLLATKAVVLDPGPSTSGLFVQSVNAMIDAEGTSKDSLVRHVPEIVLWLMLLTLAMTAFTLGSVSGLGQHPVSVPAYSLLFVILLVTHVIIDLDRPRRGLITVSQQGLLDLQKSIRAPLAEAQD